MIAPTLIRQTTWACPSSACAFGSARRRPSMARGRPRRSSCFVAHRRWSSRLIDPRGLVYVSTLRAVYVAATRSVSSRGREGGREGERGKLVQLGVSLSPLPLSPHTRDRGWCRAPWASRGALLPRRGARAPCVCGVCGPHARARRPARVRAVSRTRTSHAHVSAFALSSSSNQHAKQCLGISLSVSRGNSRSLAHMCHVRT